jgi:hypothetical protein
MKSYSNIARVRVLMVIVLRSGKIVVQMIPTFDVVPLRHYKNMSLRMDDLNVRAIKSGQYRSSNDFVDSTEHCAASAEVKDAVKGAQKLIELVRAKQDGNPPLAAKSADEIDHNLLVVRVETDQRFVE